MYRPWTIEISAMNRKGEPFTQRVEGFNARVRLHEFDHLQGVLFIDLLAKNERKKFKAKLQAIEENTKLSLG